MKPEISFLSPQRILNTLLKETAFNVTKILNHDLLKKNFQSALAINVFEHGKNIIFAVHLTSYKMYLPFIEFNIKITTYIYTDKFPAGYYTPVYNKRRETYTPPAKTSFVE